MVPLVVRSHYSFMWGTASPRDLCRRARELGYTRLALTDTDNLCGLWAFLRACRLEGLTPIVGAELTEPGSRRRAVGLVEDAEGYRNLCRLISRRWLDDGFSLKSAVIEHAPGLTFLSACPDLLEAWREAEVTAAGVIYRRLDRRADRVRRAAERLGLPAAAAPGCFFPRPEDYRTHLTLRAIGLNTSFSRLGPGDAAPRDAWLAGPDEYRRRFEAYPKAERDAQALAERLAFREPEFRTIMPPWRDPRGLEAAQVLRRAAYEGARRVYGRDLSETVVERLEHELGLIEQKGFSSYFLTVRDIIRRSPRVCGRGSGAASLTAYVLGITNVCPIKHNLYFERFINAQRRDPPDIDVDFAWDERDDVISSVLEEHRGQAAMVSSHILFQPRLAIRETAKVFGLTKAEIDEKSRRLPWFWTGGDFSTDLRTKLYQRPESRHLEFPEPWPEILELAQRIIGAPRCLSVHPGGVVITPGPIEDYAPVQTAAKGVPIIQWEKDGAEDAGLVKIDLLGNRSLGVIRDAADNVRENGRAFDEKGWEPEDDLATQEMTAQGRTMGCFYIESPAMRLLQKRSGRGDFEHLVIHSSIIRPAANDFIREYLRRLKGGAWEPIHPLLAEILDETHGIMVYQEDVSKTAAAAAGFSHAEADGLRKVMTRKDKELELADYRLRFFEGARTRGVTEDKTREIWEMMLSFSGYSFCKPHSASYARVSFQAAYLKVHFPAEFMAAVLGNQGGFYSAFAYVSEARRLGAAILPPDVNHGRMRWRGRDREIRVGLMAVKNLGRETGRRIAAERGEGFTGLDDFFSKVRPDEAEARALVHAGALDSLAPGLNRAQLLWALAGLRRKKDVPASSGLFPGEDPIAPPLPAGPEIDRLRLEFEVLGFLTDRHPIVLFEDELRGLDLVKAVDLDRWAGRRVRLAGWLICGKQIKTSKGDPMQFLTFEDETGTFETTFFPGAYHRFCRILDWNRPYILAGLVDEDFGAVSLTVDQIRPVRRQ
ncbi:MAG: DNA polymerase III subunit alpha [Pseudomonadota bacterium]